MRSVFSKAMVMVFGGICLVMALASSAVEHVKSLSRSTHQQEELLCKQFNGVEFKDDRIVFRDRNTFEHASALFARVLKSLGCITYEENRKRNGIITVELSEKKIVEHGLLGPGPEEEVETFRVVLSWSKGTENAETLPLVFTIPGRATADLGNDALMNIVTQSLRDLQSAIVVTHNRMRARLSVR